MVTNLTSNAVTKGHAMDDKPPLLYHQATLELLHEHPYISEVAVEDLDRLQRKRNIKLPASVREWYSLQQAVAWLDEYSNDDYAVPIDQLGEVERYWEAGHWHEIDLAQQGLFPILAENQYVCTWAIQLNGTDDPPVVVSFENTMPFAKWEPYAESFSTFVYTRVWDYQVIFSDATLWGNALFFPDELHFLQTHFTAEPQTFTYPTPVTYRCSKGTQRVLLWCDGVQMPPQWFLSAASKEEWVLLTQTVESCGTLAQSLPDFAPFER
jgi:hypothetical protein